MPDPMAESAFMMITLEEKIARTERLLRRMEEDQPYLRVRLSALGAEHRQSANASPTESAPKRKPNCSACGQSADCPTSGMSPSPPTDGNPTTFEQTPPARRPFIPQSLDELKQKG